MARTIIVASSAGQAKKITDFSGKTWNELKQHSNVSPLVVGDLEAVLNPGKLTLRDDSELPEGDFQVYLIPTKNKAGAMSTDEAKKLGKEIAEAIVNAAAKASEEDVNDLRTDIIEVIENHFNVTLDDNDNCEECEDAIAGALALASKR